MANNKKTMFILMFMIIIVIIIIVVSLILLVNLKKTEEFESAEDIIYKDSEQVTNRTIFYKVNNCINKYINYIKLNNKEAYEEINNDTEVSTYEDVNTFYSIDMYSVDKMVNLTVFVKGNLRSINKEQEKYYVVNLDYNNDTFIIEDSNLEEYTNATNNQISNIYEDEITIKKGQYNKIPDNNITDLSVIKIYFDDYKFKAINKPEEAFKLIDTEYKKQKFDDNLNAYKQYVKNNLEQLQDANIVKHGITTLENGNKQYVIIDNFDNYYKFSETGINKYIVILDNYTLQTNETKDKYNKLSSQEKAVSNVDKVMKLINEKNYSTVYNYLNIEFKAMYFPTLDRFTNYMKQNFFDNNIVGQMTVGNQGDNYIVTVPYKEFLSPAAEEKEAIFLVKLKEGTNFELSINMN